jgi:hypothetical protein
MMPCHHTDMLADYMTLRDRGNPSRRASFMESLY